MPPAADGQAQPHVHLMFSERQCDGIARDPEQYFKRYNAKAPAKGGARKGYGPHVGQTLTPAERAAELKALRGRWEALCNQHLAQAGRLERIDMRSHAERGTGLEPEAKQLPSQWRDPVQRANVIEFRAARRELAAARTELGRAVPDARAEVLTLETEQQRRAQRQAAAEQAERDRQRLARLSAAELGQAIARLRPPPVRELVERDPAVIEADLARQALQARHEAAQAREAQARHEAAQWRQTHPLWAKAHDTGLFRSAYLDARARIETEACQAHLTVARPLGDATLKGQQARREAKARITREQAPLLAKVAELEALRQEKARQERAQALHMRAEKARKADLAKAVVLAARLYRQGTLAVSSDEVRRVLEQISAIKGGEGVRQMHVRQALDEPQKARALQAVVQHLAPQLEPHRARTRPKNRGPSL